MTGKTKMTKPKVLIVDDDVAITQQLFWTLCDEFEVMTANNLSSAIRRATIYEPDVAILDVAMPHASGIDVARRLREVSVDTNLLMLSMYSNPEYVHQALLAGVLGYVAKESAGPVLVDAIRSVQAGRRYLSESLGYEALRRYLQSNEGHDPLGSLSARERQVLRCTVEGCSIAETARELGLSPHSVETYRSRLMSKLGIEDLPALVKFAVRHGLTSV